MSVHVYVYVCVLRGSIILYIPNQRIRYTLFLVLSSVDASNCPHHLCLVVYHSPAGFTPTLVSHGNAKEKKPYYPIWPSTLEKIKN